MTESTPTSGPFHKMLTLLSRRERTQLVAVLAVLLVVAVLQMVGIASIMPFVAVVTNPSLVEQNALATRLSTLLGLQSRQQVLVALGATVLALVVLGNVARSVALWTTLRYENNLSCRLASRLLTHYANRPYVFFLNRNAAELGKNVLSEARTVVSGVVNPGLSIVANSLVILAVIALLLIVNPSVAISIALVLCTVYGAVYGASRKLLQRIGAEQVRANAQKYRAATEVMAGIKDIKVLGREAYFLSRYKVHAYRHARNNVWAGVISALPQFALEAIAFGGMVVLLVGFIAQGIPTDKLVPLVALYAFAGYRLLPAFQSVYSSVSRLRFHMAALDVLYQDLGEGPAASIPPASSSVAPPMTVRQDIRLENARFQYPGATRHALDGLDLEIRANSTIALVGPSGSGKTTTVDAILGLLRLGSGRLLVDGVPIAESNLRAWQSTLGYVPQSIYLVDDTVAKNIALGLPDAEIDQRRVEEAARAANLHEFVTSELPKGYATVVGDRGVRLSGGQRQRIGIARALYNNPSVLIFDEATSALDGVTEDAIMESIRSLAGRKTIILIAHRLTTVQHADRIFVIEQGRVSLEGSYDELVRTSRWFRAASGE